MLVLEFALDEQKIDVDRKNNPWLNRAAQSLAEALRLAASQELDIEFTELVAGYRFRQNSNGSFFDIYLYDSLSSGAGYAASISEEIEFLFTKVEKILSKCDCENACHKCLKHYRNQNVHGQLDRFAALELLRWGKYNELAPEIPHSRQVKYISQFIDIIETSNYHVDISD